MKKVHTLENTDTINSTGTCTQKKGSLEQQGELFTNVKLWCVCVFPLPLARVRIWPVQLLWALVWLVAVPRIPGNPDRI